MKDTVDRTETARVRARLHRERQIRREAEAIAERGLRDLYDKGQRLTEETALRHELEHQMRQAQKLEAIGRLAGGVAHDFNNLLTIIVGMSHTVMQELDQTHAARPMVTEIRKAAERAARLTRQLLAFSRRQALLPTVLNLNGVVTDLEQMLGYLVGVDIDVRVVLDPTLRPISADHGQLEQVLLNLVVNARDAMPGGGRLVVETKNVDLDAAYQHEHADVKPGAYVMLAVTDTGQGLDAEARTRLFEPYFTTKHMGRGTGLGLAVVYGIVKQSKGHIFVYSEPDAGTTFRIYFPQALESRRLDLIRHEDDEPVPVGMETVLIVEDEQALLLLASGILEQQGYTVLQALNGQEAVGLARTHNGPIHLVLADVILPGLKGPEVADRIQPLRPGVKIMFMSGYTDNSLEHRDSGAAPLFLQKPFTPESLARYVRKALDS